MQEESAPEKLRNLGTSNSSTSRLGEGSARKETTAICRDHHQYDLPMISAANLFDLFGETEFPQLLWQQIEHRLREGLRQNGFDQTYIDWYLNLLKKPLTLDSLVALTQQEEDTGSFHQNLDTTSGSKNDRCKQDEHISYLVLVQDSAAVLLLEEETGTLSTNMTGTAHISRPVSIIATVFLFASVIVQERGQSVLLVSK